MGDTTHRTQLQNEAGQFRFIFRARKDYRTWVRASSPVSAVTATRKKVVGCCRRGHVGHGTGTRQEACERALAYRLTDDRKVLRPHKPRCSAYKDDVEHGER